MRIYLLLIWVTIFSDACVDRLYFDPGKLDQKLLMVDGFISDAPGPYSIKLFRSSDVEGILNLYSPIEAKQVTLYDNTGQAEVMTHQGEGVYETSPEGIKGKVGNKYQIRIELFNGSIFESDPEEILPTGSIETIYYNFETIESATDPPRHGFRVFINALAPPGGGFVRWKYAGVFSLQTYPELNNYYCNCCANPGPPAPLPCSGQIWGEFGLQYVGECTCCISYITEPETLPHLNDNAIQTNGTFKNVEMGFVEINEYSFSRNKYMLKVEQMSLSPAAYAYWKIIRDQKVGANSLFQPAFGRPTTNLHGVNTDESIGGFFYATSIDKKVTFIDGRVDSPVKLPQFRIQPPSDNCGLWSTGEQIFLNSSTIKPPEWID